MPRLSTTTVFLLSLFPAIAPAEGPRIEFEFEREKDRDRGVSNNAVTLKPGWDFAKGGIVDRVELLLEKSLDARADATGAREHETKVFLRVRHSGPLTDALTYYVRGGIGRSFGSDDSFTYAYVEPGLKLEFGESWEWLVGFREINAIDGTSGERVHKLIVGPGYRIGRHHEIELRYSRTWGDQRLHSLGVDYTYKF